MFRYGRNGGSLLKMGRILCREPGQRHIQSYCTERAEYHTHAQWNFERLAPHAECRLGSCGFGVLGRFQVSLLSRCLGRQGTDSMPGPQN